MANEIINDDLCVFKESSLNPISPYEKENEYIYLLKINEHVYKVGKTTQENLIDISNDSYVVLYIICKDSYPPPSAVKFTYICKAFGIFSPLIQ